MGLDSSGERNPIVKKTFDDGDSSDERNLALIIKRAYAIIFAEYGGRFDVHAKYTGRHDESDAARPRPRDVANALQHAPRTVL